jgi:lipopolysaccharide exporter
VDHSPLEAVIYSQPGMKMLFKLIDKLRGTFDSSSMKSRVIGGSFWLGLGSSFEYGLRFLRNVILARILAPEAFGLMAIILAVSAALESFTQIGLREAVIQSPDGEEETYLNAAWWLSSIRAIGLCIIGFMSVPLIVSIYDVPHHAALFQISFLSILFNGTLSARAYVIQKKMDFRKWITISSGGGVVIGILVAIGLSLWLHSVWALVIGYVVEAAARCFLSFYVCPFLPRLHFKKEHSQALLTYAKGMFGLPILFFVFAQTDIFVVGKLLSKKELGLYSMAISLAQIPLYLVTTILNPILMPSFSEKQYDKAWINRALIQSTRLITLIGTPVACFFALYGKDVLALAYGPQYASVALPFAILLISTLMRASGTPIANVYLAMGYPQLQRLFSFIRAALILILIYPAVKLLGLSGAAIAGTLAMSISFYFQVMRIRNLTNLNVRQYSFIFLHALMISLPVVTVWFAVPKVFSYPLNNVFVGLSGCAIAYGVTGIIALRYKGQIDYKRLYKISE